MTDNANLKNDTTIRGMGQEWVLRPTFGCLMGIENKTKKSILTIIQEFTDGKGNISDLVSILKEGTKAAGNVISDKQIENLFESEGIMTIQKQLGEFFVLCMYGGQVQMEQSKKKPIISSEDQKDSLGMNISE